MSSLAAYAYLWESGEWSLRVTHHSRQRVFFVFSAARASVPELVAIRALVPRFTNAPVTELKQEAGETSEFLAGEFANLEARGLVAAAQARGLRTRTEDTSFVSYLPAREGAALLIDDDDLARQVGEEMKRHGVPVLYSESD